MKSKGFRRQRTIRMARKVCKTGAGSGVISLQQVDHGPFVPAFVSFQRLGKKPGAIIEYPGGIIELQLSQECLAQKEIGSAGIHPRISKADIRR